MTENDSTKQLAKMVAMALAKSHGHIWGHCDQRYFTGHAQAVFTAIKEAGMVIVPRDALWSALKTAACADPANAKRIVMLDRAAFDRAMITAGEE